MKIRVAFTLDIDVDAYTNEYGVERSEVRADLQALARSAIESHLRDLGLAR